LSAPDTIVVLSDFRGVQTQQRTRSSGKQQTSLKITGEPVAVNLDEKELARAAAAAIVDVIREQVTGIGTDASKGTQAKRRTQAKAYAAGEAWAMRQFSGGKMGATPPNQTARLFNNSGRMAKGIHAVWSKSEAAWIVRFPANRFAPEFLAKPGGQAVLDRLVELVPSMRNPMAEPAVIDALERTEEMMRFVLRGKAGDARRAAEIVRLRAVRDGLRYAAQLLAA
jgi:hypothetical protein